MLIKDVVFCKDLVFRESFRDFALFTSSSFISLFYVIVRQTAPILKVIFSN